MDPRLQRRVQRYGWDKAVGDYEAGWRTQLEPAQSLMLDWAQLKQGEDVLDVACGTGLVTFRVADAVGASGSVVGVDISGEMVAACEKEAAARGLEQVEFRRSDAEALPLPDDSFDASLCGLGLMYAPDPLQAMREMHRVLRPGGRASVAIWGARAACGWADLFPITDARVASQVCPMFFHLGTQDELARTMAEAGFADVEAQRIATSLEYPSEGTALDAAFRGGAVALAYGRFDDETKEAVHAEYLASISEYRVGEGYSIPGEFVIAKGLKH